MKKQYLLFYSQNYKSSIQMYTECLLHPGTVLKVKNKLVNSSHMAESLA